MWLSIIKEMINMLMTQISWCFADVLKWTYKGMNKLEIDHQMSKRRGFPNERGREYSKIRRARGSQSLRMCSQFTLSAKSMCVKPIARKKCQISK